MARVPELAAEYDAVVVAKGPGTIVADPSGHCRVVPIGGAELGTGGTGDVLAGMVAAAIAPIPVDDPRALGDAVARAVLLHAFTGAWLTAGRPAAATLLRSFWRHDARNLRSNGFGAATTVGFGPSSALPEALPDAARVLSELAHHAPGWPL